MSDPIVRLNATLEGRYAIERKLGEGGMATVYLADDLKHERKVALKVLKPELSAVVGAERFLSEIKVTANLNHPHILPLHDSGEADGFLFYVMPYLEGESLRDRIDREKQLPVDEAVRIATAVANALDHAHRHKVIHRDIKPGNILLQDGEPVVSDFGIALAVGAGGSDRLTETGLSLGTPHYMSPEQATGDLSVGAATDIYALGCVLYEMLVGEPPYTGSTPQAILGKIITGEARAASEQRRAVPENVDGAIAKAIEKVPADRFWSAAEFAQALANEGFRYGEGTEGATPTMAGWAAAILMLGVVVGGTVVSFLERGPAPEPVLFVEAPPGGTRFVEAPLPSPDGRKLAMLVTDPVAETKIWVRSLGAEQARALDGTEGASVMFWSPDSRELIFHAAGELRRTGLDGAGDQLVASLLISAGVWTPDDELVVSSRDHGIVRMPAAGGAPRTIVEGVQYRDLSLVPTGPHLLFSQFGGQTGIHAFDLSSGDQKLLVPGVVSRVRYVAPDLFVYVENRVLLAQRFHPSDMSLVGDPFPLDQDVGNQFFAGSAAGALSFIRGATELARLVWFDRQGEVVGEAAPEGLYSEVYLSPRATQIMFVRADPVTGNQDLWVQDTAGNAPPSRLTTDADTDHLAVFSPDGQEIAWEAHADGLLNLMRRPTDGSAPAILVRAWGRAGGTDDWSPDGRFVLYHSDDSATGYNLWAVPMEGDAEPFPLLESAFDDEEGKFSPDGRWLAYVSDASGQGEIYLQRLDGMRLVGGPQRVSDGGADQPRWRRDGTELFFLSHGRLMVVDTRLDRDRPAGTPRELFDIGGPQGPVARNGYAVTPDGQRFLAIVTEGAATAESAIVILDWAAGLDGR